MIEARVCPRCATELAAAALACPACGTLIHSGELREIAERAEAHGTAGRLDDAQQEWRQALALVPHDSRQHQQIAARIEALARQAAALSTLGAAAAPDGSQSWWKRGVAGALAAGGLLLGKGKFLALGLLKAKTLLSMLAFAGVYWTTYGWPLALGLVASIYVHEMGHVAVLRQLGIAADAPLFIPGIGAMVLLRQRIDDPVVDARIGLAGPIWGLGAGVGALALGAMTGIATFRAIADLTGFINLFNLIPIWQLDGSRGFHPLSRGQRFAAVATIVAAYAATGQALLMVVGAVALFRALQANDAPGDARTLATFAGLVVALSWLARGVAR